MSTLTDPVLLLLGRLALALLLLRAAVHKLRDVAAFRAAVAAYALLPRAGVGPVAVVLIAVELALGAALLRGGIVTLPGALGAAMLVAVYTTAIAVNLLRGRRHIDCGCTGAAGRQRLSGHLVLRNGGIVFAALALAALADMAPGQARPLTWVDGVTVVAGLGTLALLYAATETLIGNAPGIAAMARHHAANVATSRHGEQHA